VREGVLARWGAEERNFGLPPQSAKIGFGLAMPKGSCRICDVKVEDVKSFAERQPFRPFVLRLSNGAQYTFNEPRNFGAPEDYHVIVYFGVADWALIDTENIVEILAR
jgi:hypothetical protein